MTALANRVYGLLKKEIMLPEGMYNGFPWSCLILAGLMIPMPAFTVKWGIIGYLWLYGMFVTFKRGQYSHG